MSDLKDIAAALTDVGAELRDCTEKLRDQREPYELVRELKRIAARALELGKYSRVMADFAHDMEQMAECWAELGQKVVDEESA